MMLRLDKGIISRNSTDKWHWSKRRKESLDWEEHIWVECNCKPPKATGKVKLLITSVRQQLLDTDNLYGGNVKQLIDAMVRLGILKDDSPDLLDLKVTQIKAKNPGHHHTVLEWEAA